MERQTRHLPGGGLGAAMLSVTVLGLMFARVSAETVATPSNIHRDPFWPLGYVAASTNTAPAPVVAKAPVVVKPPPPTAKAITEQDWENAEREIGIRPVRYSIGGRSGQNVVLLAGKIKSAGDLVQMEWNGVRCTWLVANVGLDSVQFERRSAEFISPE